MMPFSSSSLPQRAAAAAPGRVEKPAVRVEKATSHLLVGPDWTMNMDICDTVNNDQWQAKEVLKAIKKRLQNKNPKVQFLALTLLETMVKNCGEYVHFQVAERKILEEMIKIVKKKTDMQVRDKILVLLDSWQEAFGGPSGKYPQYYWAYIELKRSGIAFPQRSANAPPIFTPPVARSELTSAYHQSGVGVPIATSVSLNTAMASDTGNLSLSDFSRIRDMIELLREMLQAVNPNDREAVRDELIVELVNQGRSNQKKLMNFIGSTGDEKLLGESLELNDELQSLLARHDAIAAGTPLPSETSKSQPSATKPIEPPPFKSNPAEDDEFEDDFDELARRNSKLKQVTSGNNTSVNSSDSLASYRSDITTVTESSTSSSTMSNALVPVDYPLDPPPPVKVQKEEQDMIDLLSITLSTYSSSPSTPTTPPLVSNQQYGAPATPIEPSYSYYSQPSYVPVANHGYAPYNSYVAPWAQQVLSPPITQPQKPLQYSPSWTAANVSSPQTVNLPAYSSRPLQNYNSFGSRANGFTAAAGVGETPANANSSASYVLPNRLFEDLIDFRSSTTGTKTSTRSPFSGASEQPMISQKK
ncbi:TOM1-like protein 6 isoform X1 [Zingiber officinale]|uniref:TOM1-like protein 6 isoform X1 n=1 Tax=Zingiber officinale TaxID=94328 RepID=UPI001C4CBC72|nr:TOM1-like protein 6 isoform X1 [Zingiber officinale]